MLSRPFGNIIHDLARKYNGSLVVSNFRKLEKLTTQSRKAELDVRFLKNCQAFGVYPKFITFDLHNVSNLYAVYIRKRLLRTSIRKRVKEKKNHDNDLDKQWQKLKGFLSSIDLLILKKVRKRNVERKVSLFIKTHEKKLIALTKNTSVPFTHNDTVINISSYRMCDEELDILKFGLSFAIKPPHIRKSQVFTTFELLHDDLMRHLWDKTKANEVRNEIQHLATSYVNFYEPSMNDLKKHRILKRLKHNKDIIILRPDKRNGVVVIDTW